MTTPKYNGPLFSEAPKYKESKDILIQVLRINGRAVRIIWNDLSIKLFPNKQSTGYLEVSDAPDQEFTVLEEIPYNHAPQVIDSESILNFFRSPILYYRLRFPDAGVVSKVFSSEKEPNMYAAEMMRRHSIQLKEGHAGNLFYLFIKRRSKDRCPDCWDDLRAQRTRVSCPTCMNTGFIGGYYDPIPFYASVFPENENFDQPIDGTATAANLQGWTVGYPRISLGDVIVDAGTREVWNVMQVNLTTHKRVPTKQDFILKYQEDDISTFKVLDKVPNKADSSTDRHKEDVF